MIPYTRTERKLYAYPHSGMPVARTRPWPVAGRNIDGFKTRATGGLRTIFSEALSSQWLRSSRPHPETDFEMEKKKKLVSMNNPVA